MIKLFSDQFHRSRSAINILSMQTTCDIFIEKILCMEK